MGLFLRVVGLVAERLDLLELNFPFFFGKGVALRLNFVVKFAALLSQTDVH